MMDDNDIIDIFFKPLYLVCDVIREFLFLLYIGLGLLFLFFLIDREFPSFKMFCEGVLRALNLYK